MSRWYEDDGPQPAWGDLINGPPRGASDTPSAGARAQLMERANQPAHAVPGVMQSPLDNRHDYHAGARFWYGQRPIGRGRYGPSGAVPARVAVERREPSTAGRPAHTEFLPPGRGRAARPATPIPTVTAKRDRNWWAPDRKPDHKKPGLLGRIFAGGRQ